MFIRRYFWRNCEEMFIQMIAVKPKFEMFDGTFGVCCNPYKLQWRGRERYTQHGLEKLGGGGNTWYPRVSYSICLDRLFILRTCAGEVSEL